MTVAPIETRVAHTGADELRFHGHRVFAELLGRTSFGRMLMLGITGRVLDDRELAIVDDMVTAMSSADPRLWPFKVSRLGSAYGRAVSGVAATLVAGEGGMYGPNRLAAIADWLERLDARAREAAIDDDGLHAILQEGAVGFGILYRARDERFEALTRQLQQRNHDGRVVQLCLRAVGIARSRLQLEPHVYLLVAALSLDLGMTSHQIAMLGTAMLFHAALANAAEGSVQQPRMLRVLPCETVDYRGIAARRSPRALAGAPLVPRDERP